MVGFEEMRDELLERIEDLLKRKQYPALRDLLADLEPADIASLFEDLDEDSIPLLFRLLPKEPAAEVFVELDPDAQEMLIRGFSNTELKEVLDELYLDDTVDIVEDGQVTKKKHIALPEELTDIIACKNPRCITSIEQELDQIFILTDPEKEVYRCKYCEEKYTNPNRR